MKNYVDCLTDIELALEAGYPNHMVYKLYIRQCKCLLELTRIPEAQEAFDKAIDAIDRSGMKKDMRIGITADLQEAFINLAKSCEENPMPQEIQHTSNVRYILKKESLLFRTYCLKISQIVSFEIFQFWHFSSFLSFYMSGNTV